MPIVLDRDIPAYKILSKEKIFVMEKERASSQDIRPIEVALLNLMPTKEETETQFMRLLSNSPLQVNLTLIHTESYRSKHTEIEYLDKFYKSFEEIKNQHFDGMIITGAPVETMEFSDVAYWDELKKIFEFTKTNVTSTIFICWGAMAALHYFYDVNKHNLEKKWFGVYKHHRVHFDEPIPLMRGISDEFHMPHSRYSTVYFEDIDKHPQLKTLAYFRKRNSSIHYPSIISNNDYSQIFVLGHMEYDRNTLKTEYERDLKKGLDVEKPINYFADKKCTQVNMNWSSSSNLFYNNWLNYCVYQVTPYQFKK